MESSDRYKRLAAERALTYVRPGMVLGLGTGSTARHFVELLGDRVRKGLRITGVPTSEATREQADALGIPLATLDECLTLDIDVDGADEFDSDLNLIKGGGGALLREKIVAAASREMIVIADASKHVGGLGAFPLPIEIHPYGFETTRRRISEALSKLNLPNTSALRTRDGGAFITDGGHFIVDFALSRISDPKRLAKALDCLVGVVDHGLFIEMATRAIVAGPEGVVEFTRARHSNQATKPRSLA